MFVAIDRTSKFSYVELLDKYGKQETAQFLRNLVVAVSYKIHTILTDNDIQFTNRKTDRLLQYAVKSEIAPLKAKQLEQPHGNIKTMTS